MGNCGFILTKPCLSESDNRYDANYPQTIVGQVRALHSLVIALPIVQLPFVSPSSLCDRAVCSMTHFYISYINRRILTGKNCQDISR